MKKCFFTIFSFFISTSIMATSYSNNDCCIGSTNIYADFLWWTAQGDQLDYGLYSEGVRVDGDPDVETLSEKWLEFTPDWNPGFRVGFETEVSCTNICVFGEWTSYKTDDSRKTELVRSDADGALLTFNSDFVGGTGLSLTKFETAFIESDFYFQMNRLDLGFCKSCCLCDGLHLRPYVAFTYAHLKENMKLLAKFDNTQTTFFKTDDYKTDTTYSGYGAKLGFAADWRVFNCFSLFSEGSFTGLWGKYEIDNTFIISEGGTINDIVFNNTFDFDDWRGRVISQVQLGVRYETCFCNQYPFLVQVGWEYQVLFDQTNWLVRGGQLATLGGKPAANLVLQGLVVRAGLGF